LYAIGARRFVLINVPTLNQAPLYALPSEGGVGGNKYWPDKPSNLTTVNYRMRDLVASANEGFKFQTQFQMSISGRYAGAKMALFDVHQLVCMPGLCLFFSLSNLSLTAKYYLLS
jgi:hypothetical protein